MERKWRITAEGPEGNMATFEFEDGSAVEWATTFKAMMTFATFMPSTIDLVINPDYYDELVG